MRAILTVFLIGALSLAALAQTPTREAFLQAVEAFEKDPLTPEVDAQLKTIVQFVTDSPDVMVTVDPTNFPLEKDTPDPVRMLMLGAFMGGNAREQVRLKKKGDQSYAGVQLMLKTYKRLQTRAKFNSPGLDNLADLEAKGKLKAYLKRK